MNQDSQNHDQTTAGFSQHGSERIPTESEPERWVLTLLCHPDPARMGHQASLDVLKPGAGRLGLSRNRLDFVAPGKKLGLPLEDPFVSREPIWLSVSAQGDFEVDRGSSRTDVLIVGQSLQQRIQIPADRLEQGVPLILADRVMLWLQREKGPASRLPDLGMVGESWAMNQLRREIMSVADLDVSVLLRGPTGSGKERVAQAIHEQGSRRSGPFVAVNLGAIPATLAASELFGAVKGAYTGSQAARQGYFAAAHLGTLFLDEVGEAQPELQAMLLRVLETGEYFPVGAATPRKSDVRVVAATDAGLEDLVSKGLFREPLFHRLAGYSIWVPALQRRKKDYGLLFRHFAQEILAEMGQPPWRQPKHEREVPWLHPQLMAKLIASEWPGNVRQFKNVVRQLLIGNRGSKTLQWTPALAAMIGPSHEQPQPVETSFVPQGNRPILASNRPADISEGQLLAALKAARWNFKAAAENLGISRASLYLLTAKSQQIRKAEDLTSAELATAHDAFNGDIDRLADHFSVSRQALVHRLRAEGL